MKFKRGIEEGGEGDDVRRGEGMGRERISTSKKVRSLGTSGVYIYLFSDSNNT